MNAAEARGPWQMPEESKNGDGEDFSDDDLDALPSEDFLELEDHAYRSTQQASVSVPSKLQGIPQARTRDDSNAIVAAAHYEEPSSSDYGNAEDLFQLEEQVPVGGDFEKPVQARAPVKLSEAALREQWRRNRFSHPARVSLDAVASRQPLARSGIVLPHRESRDHSQLDSEPEAGPPTLQTDNDPDIAWDNVQDPRLLQHELERLRLENDSLRRAAKDANEQLLIKTGEISIVRSNQEKTIREHQRKLEDQQRQHAKESEKHRVEIDQARKESEKLATDNRFLNHEMNDQTWRLKQAQRSARERRADGTVTTPKKLGDRLFGDGFNDDEIGMSSPQRSAGKQKASTPKAGAKRKRNALADSPAQPLPLSPSDSFIQDIAGSFGPKDLPVYRTVGGKDRERLDFLQLFLNHRIHRQEKRTLEVLAAYSLPSDASVTLSSLILDKITPADSVPDDIDFPGMIGLAVSSVWSQCITAEFYDPIRHLMDFVKFILFNGSAMTAAYMIDHLVPLAQQTADVNVIPRYMRFKRKTAATDSEVPQASEKIDPQQCLQVLDLVVTMCASLTEHAQRFWRSMRFDFISMLLRNSQDLDDVMIILKMLGTSVSDESFAMIVAPPASQTKSEQHVIDRVSSMLIEVPKPITDDQTYDPIAIAELRLQVLGLIEAMCETQYCGEAFAKHPQAVGRLVRALNEAINGIYEYKSGHHHRIEIINQSTRLLHHVTRKYATIIGNLQDKLRGPPTSIYMYLISLSRLSFSEGLFFDEGIDEDVLECANQMLDEIVTPEEAEALQKVFLKDDKE